MQRVGDARGSELGEENRGADAERNGEEQSDASGNQRAVDKGKRAELVEDGIPNSGDEEIEAELVARQNGACPEFENEQNVMRTTEAAKTNVTRRAISSPSRKC